ncbi:hypothetical protein JVU11DRAFT_5145 [Chiua virens]|nr:hypothetical protein JVU11DRAFT_5145 [Chiua virens]
MCKLISISRQRVYYLIHFPVAPKLSHQPTTVVRVFEYARPSACHYTRTPAEYAGKGGFHCGKHPRARLRVERRAAITQLPNDVVDKPETPAYSRSGPRFEQTYMELQPNPLSAMELIANEPVRCDPRPKGSL